VAEGIAGRLVVPAGSPFELGLGDLGTFRSGRLVRVVWLGVRTGAAALQALAAQIEDECRHAGLPPEARPHQPHLTLARARARGGAALPVLPSPPVFEPWLADELVLYSSRLGRPHAVHEPMRTIRLGA
jgi:2'-5' RNA ligase